jgi:phospholipid-binding lipoprotein MlaA
VTTVWPWPRSGRRPKGGNAGGRRFGIALALIGLCALGGCATPPTDPDALAAYKEANDPLEPMNRYFFDVNTAADELLFKPLAGWYYVALPNFAQDGIRNALRNLRTPVILANDLFQGETDRAGTTFGRFLVNSTMGLGGLFDVASRMGMNFHDEDFGQTLAVHGVHEGPYLMLPLFGPSNPRDLAGTVVDTLLDPLTYVGFVTNVKNIGLATTGLGLLDERARNLKTLDQIRKGSLDYYATIRSLYRQRRQDEINNGASPPGGVGLEGGDTSAVPAPPVVSFLATKEPIGTVPTAYDR